MEEGVKLWKHLFGHVREVDYEEFQDSFISYIENYGDLHFDSYQMRYVRDLIDPDKQCCVSISDFLIFFTTFWIFPSKRKAIFQYEFIVQECHQQKESNNFEYIQLTLSNKNSLSSVKYLQTGSQIDIYTDRLVLNKTVVQNLNKQDVVKMGSNDLNGQNDIVFPDICDVYPLHCKIGVGKTGYYVKDQSKKQNKMRFHVGHIKPLVLDYKMVFEISSSSCLFSVKKIFPEPIFEDINVNFVNYVFTSSPTLEQELLEFSKKTSTHVFHNVAEWRQNQIQSKKNQKQSSFPSSNNTQDDAFTQHSLEIECIEGELKGQSFTIKGTHNSLTIGRDKSSNIHIKHISVSSHHAQIYFNKLIAAWVIKEPTSTLGTFIYLANHDQYIRKSHSNFHLIQQDLPFELHNYVFHPKLVLKKKDDL